MVSSRKRQHCFAGVWRAFGVQCPIFRNITVREKAGPRARGRAHGTEGALVAGRDGHQGEGGDGTRAPSNSRSAAARRVSETRLTSASSASGGWPGGHRSSQCRCASGRGRPTYLVGAVGRAWPPTTPFHERRDRCERHFDVGDLRGLPGALAKIWRGCPTRSVGRRTPGPCGSGPAVSRDASARELAGGRERTGRLIKSSTPCKKSLDEPKRYYL
jgi:hypothetical protein